MDEPLGIQWIKHQRNVCLDVIYSQNMNGADFKCIITKRYLRIPLIELFDMVVIIPAEELTFSRVSRLIYNLQ